MATPFPGTLRVRSATAHGLLQHPEVPAFTAICVCHAGSRIVHGAVDRTLAWCFGATLHDVRLCIVLTYVLHLYIAHGLCIWVASLFGTNVSALFNPIYKSDTAAAADDRG